MLLIFILIASIILLLWGTMLLASVFFDATYYLPHKFKDGLSSRIVLPYFIFTPLMPLHIQRSYIKSAIILCGAGIGISAFSFAVGSYLFAALSGFACLIAICRALVAWVEHQRCRDHRPDVLGQKP